VKRDTSLGVPTTDYADGSPPNDGVPHTRLACSAACYVTCKLAYCRPRACERQTPLAHRFFVKSPLDEEKNLRLGGDDVRVGVVALAVRSDRVVIIEGPAGYKRTWWMAGTRTQAGASG